MSFADFLKFCDEMSILRRPVLASNPHASPRGAHYFGVARGIAISDDIAEAISTGRERFVDGIPQLIIAPGKTGLYSICADMDGARVLVAVFKPLSVGDSVRDGATNDMEELSISYWSEMPNCDYEL